MVVWVNWREVADMILYNEEDLDDMKATEAIGSSRRLAGQFDAEPSGTS